jgi:hypothetical protein
MGSTIPNPAMNNKAGEVLSPKVSYSICISLSPYQKFSKGFFIKDTNTMGVSKKFSNKGAFPENGFTKI